MRAHITSIALLVALVPAPSIASVVIANSANVTAGVLARIDAGGNLAVDMNEDNFLDSPRSLAADATASSTNAILQRISGTSSVRANFVSADSFSVTVNLSRAFSGNGTIIGTQNNRGGNGGSANFTYLFTPTVDAILNITANVSVQGGNPFGFQGFAVRSDNTTLLGQFNVNDPTMSSSTSVRLNRNVVYDLVLVNGSNITGVLSSNFDSSVLGEFTFDFVAAAVPEPATWAMMLTGFGFVGAAARRRKPAVRVSMG